MAGGTQQETPFHFPSWKSVGGKQRGFNNLIVKHALALRETVDYSARE